MQTDSLKILVVNSKNIISFFGLPIDPIVFTVLTPIIILFVGYLLNKENEKKKEKNKLHDIRLYFYSQVESLLNVIPKQKTKVDEYINKLKEEKIQNLEFSLLVDFQIKHLLDLPKTDLFTVIVSKERKTKEKRLALFWKCQQSFDLVDWYSKNFKDRFDYVFTKCSEYERRWNEAFTFVAKFHDRWITDVAYKNIDIKSDPFLNGFWELYHAWAKSGASRDMYIVEQKLIDPLIQHCKDTQPNYYGLYLLEELLACKAAVENHRNLRNIAVDEFGKNSKNIDVIFNDLTTALNELKATQKY